MKTTKKPVSRIVIAGTSSGCGKTTVVLALLQAFKNRGIDVGSFKAGPDYIDPMFHSHIIGAPSSNLDPYFFDDATLKYLLAKHGEGRRLNVIEGVMGFYDGLGLTSSRASTYELAKRTNTPVVLVVNAGGASLSVLAQIQGFMGFKPDCGIAGVILNNCSSSTYEALKPEIEELCGVSAFGFLPRLASCVIESRHLGLVAADEIADLKSRLALLAEQAEKSLELDGLIALAEAAPFLEYSYEAQIKRERVRLAVARDRAFCFYYDDNLSLLEEMGAELLPFSPLDDDSLPENIHGLYLGGGYPELHLDRLCGNEKMLASIRGALENKLPVIAECGGFMYLNKSIAGHSTVGFLGGDCFDAGRLTRFGYIELTAKSDNMLCRSGDTIRAHEFHHWDCTDAGDSFTARKANGRSWSCAFSDDTLYAGFPHFNFYANPAFAENFYSAMLKEKKKNVK